MGDNIWLPDRDGVRTPMQWTPDRNAGFSTADPGRLRLPVIQSLSYNHQSVNVEAQRAQESSLLHWVRAMLAVRREHPAFGTGSFDHRPAGDEAILAFTRMTDDETLLVAANLAGSARAASLDLAGFAGCTPVDVLGGAPFPTIGPDGKLNLAWVARGFYWLRLDPPN
jgi:maltose alpha-D-glucosyltransferase/alpha-amylase